jgi:uncharacterized membrane protein
MSAYYGQALSWNDKASWSYPIGGRELPPLGLASVHGLFAAPAQVALLITLFGHGCTIVSIAGKTLFAVLGLEFIDVLLLSLGGWYGGHLVFHYGIG